MVFLVRLEQDNRSRWRDARPVSLIAMDLNGFKEINDTYGHQQGDRVLCVIAEVSVATCASTTRWCATPEMSSSSSCPTRQQAGRGNRDRGSEEAVRETTVEAPARPLDQLSGSFGAATYPGDAEHADASIAVADQGPCMPISARVARRPHCRAGRAASARQA